MAESKSKLAQARKTMEQTLALILSNDQNVERMIRDLKQEVNATRKTVLVIYVITLIFLCINLVIIWQQ